MSTMEMKQTPQTLLNLVSSPFPLEALAGIIVGVIIMLIAIGVIIGILIWWQGILGKDTPKWLIVTIVILCFVVVGFGILLYLLIRLWCIEDKTDSPDSPKSGKGKKRRGKKSQDIPMESGREYGRLQHGGTLTPTYTDTSADPMYSHLAEGKAEEGSAEEYSQLQRQKPAKPVANISDANYSHFEGESGGEYGRLQHGGTLTPTYTDTSADPMYSHLAAGKAEEGSAEEYSQLQRQEPAKAVANISDANYSHFEGDPLPPEVYSEVNQGPLYKMKQTSLTGL